MLQNRTARVKETELLLKLRPKAWLPNWPRGDAFRPVLIRSLLIRLDEPELLHFSLSKTEIFAPPLEFLVTEYH